jgi:transcription initiation factor TFIID subunit 8
MGIIVVVVLIVLMELGRTTRMFTELAGRVEPTAGDVVLSLVDMGIKVDPVGLRAFSRRSTRPTIPVPGTIPLPKVPSILSAGKKRALPGYIPDHFPPMPDPHAYIRTPVSYYYYTSHVYELLLFRNASENEIIMSMFLIRRRTSNP